MTIYARNISIKTEKEGRIFQGWCEYEVSIIDDDLHRSDFIINHRRDEGAHVLIRKILEEYERSKT
jgi:hypothetical protein